MSSQEEKIIANVAEEVRQQLTGEGSGHDWWHIARVWNMAKRIGPEEKADMFIVELAALTHDSADWKFHGGDESAGPRAARALLEKYGAAETSIAHVCDIVATVSFKGAGVGNKIKTIEGAVVQDADRLDAIGAIGIARAFAYGGHQGRSMWEPDQRPELRQTKERYMKNTSNTVNHFYEKLLLLKDRMNTLTAKKIAEERHRFMEDFLSGFYKEWEGKA